MRPASFPWDGPAPPLQRSPMAGRFARSLGGRHAGGGYHQLHGQDHVEGSSQDLHLTERFTRTAPDTILYQFTVDDPAAFAAPWTAEIPMHAAQGPLAEYACQENNEGLRKILAGARAEEAKPGEGVKSPK